MRRRLYFAAAPAGLCFFLMGSMIVIGITRMSIVSAEDQASSSSYGGECDYNSFSDSTPRSQLTPNQFHKICPQQRSGASFGQPLCGDGTTFHFFASRPTQKKDNAKKILIEFLGGGACWDDQTCGMQASYLTFPQKLDDFMGLSCSEISYGTKDQNGFPINMLCSDIIGETDFSEYNTIIVPYCTQDVHIGSNTMTYDDGTTVYHRGGHNTISVLRWLFSNFKNPTNIILTGCSAGATVLPVAYGLINNHYNRFGARSTQIDVIADSPVFLTPSYFLNTAFDNWNPNPIIQRIGFNFRKWRTSEEYPVRIWNHVLRQGSNRDRWGFVSHTTDEISLFYYQWMSGMGEDDNQNRRRHLNQNNNNDLSSQWFTELSQSIQSIQTKHKNVADFWIDSDGHCSFGLYYPLQEDGFEAWLAEIIKERRILQLSGAVPLFLMSFFVGAGILLGAFFLSKKRQGNADDFEFMDETSKESSWQLVSLSSRFTAWYAPFSVTFAFICASSLYFWAMVISQGFAHPLNNPSIGPTAIQLSSFGINNPALIVYKFQLHRLFTSAFLCSGVITYLMVISCLISVARPLEQMMGENHLHFSLIGLLILFGSNLLYALIGNGATCCSLGLVLGLNVVYIILRKRSENLMSWRTIVSTVLLFVLASIFSPFDSWILLLGSVVIAALVATQMVQIVSTPHGDGLQSAEVDEKNQMILEKKRASGLAAFYGVLFLAILFRFRKPNPLYVQPFYTGCSLMYAQGEDIASLAGSYGGDGEDEHRFLKEEDGFDYEKLCAEICLPSIGAGIAQYGADRYFGFPITSGTCEEIGSYEHIADKTFEYFSYSLDVEIFQTLDEDEDDERRI